MTSHSVTAWTARLAVTTVCGVIALLPATHASAHSELLESTPAAGSELNKAPTEVQLVFGESVQQQGGSIVVAAGDTIISQPKTFVVDGNTASVQLTGPGEPGLYTVDFRVVSADGHVVSESFEYKVIDSTSPSETDDPTQSPTTEEPLPETTNTATDTPEDSSSSVVWVLGLGAIGIVLVIAVISVAVRGRRERSD